MPQFPEEKWLSGMDSNRARDVDLPLSFLGAGDYTAKIWKDAPDAESEPNHLITETFSISSGKPIKIHLARDGGFVAQIAPVTK